MRIVSGKVIDGKIVVEGVALDEGVVVTVVAPEDDRPFELSADDEAELLFAIDEADRRQVVAAVDVIERLRRLG